MDRAGEEFFARACLTQHKRGQLRLGAFLQIAEEPEQMMVLRDDAESAAFVAQLLQFCIPQLAAALGHGAQPCQLAAQVL